MTKTWPSGTVTGAKSPVASAGIEVGLDQLAAVDEDPPAPALDDLARQADDPLDELGLVGLPQPEALEHLADEPGRQAGRCRARRSR